MNRLARLSFANLPAKFGATASGIGKKLWDYLKKRQKTGDKTLIGLCCVR